MRVGVDFHRSFIANVFVFRLLLLSFLHMIRLRRQRAIRLANLNTSYFLCLALAPYLRMNRDQSAWLAPSTGCSVMERERCADGAGSCSFWRAWAVHESACLKLHIPWFHAALRRLWRDWQEQVVGAALHVTNTMLGPHVVPWALAIGANFC